MRRHAVIDHGWDENKKMGWMRFKCLRCEHQYKKWMKFSKLWEFIPPKIPGGKTTRRKQAYTQAQIKFFAQYWREESGGCSVSFCVCMDKRSTK